MFTNMVNYLYHLVMGRLMGPVEYGVLASLYSILYIISIIPMSTSFAMVKFVSSTKNEEELSSVYLTLKKFVSKLALAGMLIVLLLSPLISNFLNLTDTISVVTVGPILFFSLICLVNQATLQGILKFAGSAVPSFVSSILKLVFGVLLVIFGWRSFGAMVGVLIAITSAYYLSSWYLKRNIKIKSGQEFDLKPFFKYAFPVLVQALAFTSFFTADVILVKHYFSGFEAGLYAALSMLGKIIYFATSPITATMFPIVSGRKSRNEGFKKVFLVSITVTFSVSFFIVTFYKFFPSLAIGLLYGKAYLVASGELFLMGVFTLFYTLSYFLVNFLLSLGEVKTAYLPLFFAIVQITGIVLFHETLGQVIGVSLTSASVLFGTLILFLGYNQLWRKRNFFQ